MRQNLAAGNGDKRSVCAMISENTQRGSKNVCWRVDRLSIILQQEPWNFMPEAIPWLLIAWQGIIPDCRTEVAKRRMRAMQVLFWEG